MPCVVPSTVGAEDFAKERLANWHQWRGPLATGAAPHGDPPVKWDEETNVKWKRRSRARACDADRVGDQVFVVTAIDTGRVADTADRPKRSRAFEKKTKAPKYLAPVCRPLLSTAGPARNAGVGSPPSRSRTRATTRPTAAPPARPRPTVRSLYVSFGSARPLRLLSGRESSGGKKTLAS